MATVPTGNIRKRKADNQDNERLSKRLSRLNLGSSSPSIHLSYISSNRSAERNGQVLYVPVEQPSINTTTPSQPNALAQTDDNDLMQVDETKHRVFIYNLDDELSDSESDDGKVIFLPDLEKHLRESRIPQSILANSEGELAGNKQLVLYSVPSSLTVPEEQDSVRRAIIEARARTRAKQDQKREEDARRAQMPNELANDGVYSKDWYTQNGTNGAVSSVPVNLVLQEQVGTYNGTAAATDMVDNDPDAMDLE